MQWQNIVSCMHIGTWMGLINQNGDQNINQNLSLSAWQLSIAINVVTDKSHCLLFLYRQNDVKYFVLYRFKFCGLCHRFSFVIILLSDYALVVFTDMYLFRRDTLLLNGTETICGSCGQIAFR